MRIKTNKNEYIEFFYGPDGKLCFVEVHGTCSELRMEELKFELIESQYPDVWWWRQ